MDMMTYESYEKMVEKVAWLAARQYGLDQEDCRQDAWLALMEAESRYDASKGAKSTYLWTVCWNRLADKGRYWRRRRSVELKDDPMDWAGWFATLTDGLSEDAQTAITAILEAPAEVFRGGISRVRKWIKKQLSWTDGRVSVVLAEIREGLEG